MFCAKFHMVELVIGKSVALDVIGAVVVEEDGAAVDVSLGRSCV